MAIRSEEGLAPLHYAARNNCLEIVKLLVNNNAEIDPVKYSGTNFICTSYFICFIWEKLIAPFLFNCCSDDNGWTPLTYAAAEGHELIVDYLLEKEADVNGKFFADESEANSKKVWLWLIMANTNDTWGDIEYLLVFYSISTKGL